ncbi:MAG: hypothetical protein SVM80_09950 [Halobacteriota archaeon]|nr:hypothetical protein [Halobacteriota archaeon]
MVESGGSPFTFTPHLAKTYLSTERRIYQRRIMLALDGEIGHFQSSLHGCLVEKEESKTLLTSWTGLDLFMGGFPASKVTLIDSESPTFINEVTSLLCVRSIEDFDGGVVYIDGGNSIDPYRIAEFSRRSGMDQQSTLSKIFLSRAFTAYQLSTIITEKLGEMIHKCNPPLLVVSRISNLFLDGALSKDEAKSVMGRCLTTIKDLTVENDMITVITNNIRRNHHHLPLRELIYQNVDGCLVVELSKKGLKIGSSDGYYTEFCTVLNHQRRLEEFGGGQLYGAHS